MKTHKEIEVISDPSELEVVVDDNDWDSFVYIYLCGRPAAMRRDSHHFYWCSDDWRCVNSLETIPFHPQVALYLSGLVTAITRLIES